MPRRNTRKRSAHQVIFQQLKKKEERNVEKIQKQSILSYSSSFQLKFRAEFLKYLLSAIWKSNSISKHNAIK